MKKKIILTEDEIKHIARLANLPLTQEEINKFQEQLSEVVDYINKLNKINTDKVEPIAQLTDLVKVYKKDIQSSERSLTQEEASKNAKAKKNGFIKTKSIFNL
ncbi:Asp-tRNA(Asn)/Glu-tRNA(Gln) amidotransferase subunit GatC [Candidatus Roizmanbacteria bacterium]|nr:Asp-tRNA(Asn)/Glu-tRNA(Gln) amidotransferase subunit GatC [Candidatus Roizmanbacteria bacterium]